MTEVTFIAKPGCHLCDEARPIVVTVVAEFDDVSLRECSIHDDPQLAIRYGEDIPVVIVDGRVHATWRVDATRLRATLQSVTNKEHA